MITNSSWAVIVSSIIGAFTQKEFLSLIPFANAQTVFWMKMARINFEKWIKYLHFHNSNIANLMQVSANFSDQWAFCLSPKHFSSSQLSVSEPGANILDSSLNLIERYLVYVFSAAYFSIKGSWFTLDEGMKLYLGYLGLIYPSWFRSRSWLDWIMKGYVIT